MGNHWQGVTENDLFRYICGNSHIKKLFFTKMLPFRCYHDKLTLTILKEPRESSCFMLIMADKNQCD